MIEVTSPTLSIDPENFVPRKGILTRYGRKLLEEGAKYYKRITINDPVPTREEAIEFYKRPLHPPESEATNDLSQFARISIPLAHRIYGTILGQRIPREPEKVDWIKEGF